MGEVNDPDPLTGAASDLEVIGKVRNGETAAFELLVLKYQPRIFAIARKYARLEREVEDIVQEIFLKAYRKLDTFRGESPFEHWLARLAVHTCYDFLRGHQRNREDSTSQFGEPEGGWLEYSTEPPDDDARAAAARALVHTVLEQLTPPERLIITLLEIEERSVKEISQLTGWSIPLVKVRAFRARAALKKCLSRMDLGKYL